MLQNMEQWLADHWGWLGTIIAVLLAGSAHFWQNHAKVEQVRKDLEEVSERVAKIEQMEINRATVIATMEVHLSFLVEAIKEMKEDIKQMRDK